MFAMASPGCASSGTPTSPVSGTPRSRKHRISEDATTTRKNLQKAKAGVVKELKKVFKSEEGGLSKRAEAAMKAMKTLKVRSVRKEEALKK